MAIFIQPATERDAPDMYDVGMAAFKNDVHQKAMYHYDTASPEQLEAYRKWRISMNIARMGRVGNHYFKAFDSTSGALAGFVGLCGPEWHDGNTEAREGTVPVPNFIDQESQDDYMRKLKETMKETMGDRTDYWFVQSMAVHPDFQGRGIAKRLLETGVKEALENGMDVYLAATPAGRPLYLRCGFKEAREIVLMDGAYRMAAMVRRSEKPQ